MRFPLFRTSAVVVLALIVIAILTACGGGAAAPTQATYDASVAPFTAEQAAPYLDIPNPSNEKPCGVFDVKGFGPKTALLKDFPNCAPGKYRVFCLNDQAQWIEDNISELHNREAAGAVDFTSAQEGICALFPWD